MTMNEDRMGTEGIREAPLERRAHGARELMDGDSERTAENDVVHVAPAEITDFAREVE